MKNSSVPTEAVAIYNHALELSNKGDMIKALKEYHKAIDLHPSFVEAYNNIGEIYSQMGNRKEAISTYMEALKIGKNYRILLNLGVEHYNSKNFEIALNFFRESLNEKIDFLEGHFYAAMVYYNMKKFKEAEHHFRSVIAIDSKHLKAHYMLSYIYYEWKQYNKVIEVLESIRDIADDKAFFNKYYGFCSYYMGNYKVAIEYLTSALELQPKYKKFKGYLKNLSVEKKVKEIGDVDNAIKNLEKQMIEDSPSFREISELSMLYIFKGRNQEAEKLLLEARNRMAS